MNLLNWNGPEFLEFYFSLLIVAVVAAFMARVMLKHSISDTYAADRKLNVYEFAMLAGRPIRALQAMLVTLVAQESVRSVGLRQYRVTGGILLPASTFKNEVHRFIAALPNATIRQIQLGVYEELSAIEFRLMNDGLIARPASRRLSTSVSSGTILSVVALGVAKIVIGLSRNRPVGFLVLGCLLGAGIAIAFATVQPWRTAAGERVLRERTRQVVGRSSPRNHELASLLISFALLGPAELLGTPYAGLRADFLVSGGDGGGWSGSSCGGSSCGGGTSCGGGGGGGCGGCGGGH